MIELRTASGTDRIALRGVRLRSHLIGMSQKTTVEQTFVNLEEQAIEAVYTFPLPEDAAVCGFEVVTDDRVLTGKIEEKETAIEQYIEAISDGNGAFMMEQDRPDVFTIRVGSLKPAQAVTIRLTYVSHLEIVDRTIRLAFPTTVAPRYVTDSGMDPVEAMIDGDAMNPPHHLHVPYGLALEVDVALGRPTAAISSPSHTIVIKDGNSDRHRVTLAGELTEMDRDIVLEIRLENDTEPQVQVDRRPDGETFVAVTFIPEFEVDEYDEPGKSDVVFVVDCSGSMGGESINQARNAMGLCLRSLNEGDTFNICRFGSTFELMSPEPVVYSAHSLKQALGYMEQVNADLGGTELLKPLSVILRQKPPNGTVRQTILLTDGQVSNDVAVIDLARKHRDQNRIFAFGIGSACSTHLVRGLARATGGAAEFISSQERIDTKVLRTFSRMASPMVSDVKIDWGDAQVQQAMDDIPLIFDGDALTVLGKVVDSIPDRIALRCQSATGPKEWTLQVPGDTADEGTLGLLWARRRIQCIEDSPELIALSKRYSILCGQTTFVAIEHRSLDDRARGEPELRRIPVMMARGWGGMNTTYALDATANVSLCTAHINLSELHRKSLVHKPSSHVDVAPCRKDSEDAWYPIESDADQGFHAILACQNADGSFDFRWSGDFADVRQIVDEIQDLFKSSDGAEELDRVTNTVLAMLTLQTRFAEHGRLTKRAYHKGLRYLANAFSQDITVIETRLGSWQSMFREASTNQPKQPLRDVKPSDLSLQSRSILVECMRDYTEQDMGIRVFILARTLGTTSKTILVKCRAEGIEIKNHTSRIDVNLAARIIDWFEVWGA
jgi:Ca-activated chloride channel homolog